MRALRRARWRAARGAARSALTAFALIVVATTCDIEKLTGSAGGQHPMSISLAIPDTLHVGAKTTLALRVNGAMPPAGAVSVRWSSNAPTTARVDSTGAVEGLARGNATITATVTAPELDSAITVQGVVHVYYKTIRAGPRSHVLTSLGQTLAIETKGVSTTGVEVQTLAGVAYTILDTAILSLPSSSSVRSKRNGTGRVVATFDGLRDTLVVTVQQLPSNITVYQGPVAVSAIVLNALNHPTALRAESHDALGNLVEGATHTWQSSAPGIMAVTTGGVATASALGSVSLTVTANGVTSRLYSAATQQRVATASVVAGNNQSATVATAVATPPVVQLRDSGNTTIAGQDVTFQVTLGGGTITNAVVATASDGRASPGAWTLGTTAGANRLTATSDGQVATIDATGRAGAATQAAAEAGTGQVGFAGDSLNTRLAVKVRDTYGNDVPAALVRFTGVTGGTFTPTDTVRTDAAGIARIRAWLPPVVGTHHFDARVVGTAAPTVRFTATAQPAPVATAVVAPAADTLYVGDSSQFTVTLRDRHGNVLTGRTVTWTSRAPAVATVGTDGVVVGVDTGTARIVATSEGISDSASILVRPVPVARLELARQRDSIEVGDTTTLSAQPYSAANQPLAGRVVTWSSADAAVATVGTAGLVTGRAEGTVFIRAHSEGVVDSIAIRVYPAVVVTVEITPAPAALALYDSLGLAVAVRDARGGSIPGRAVAWASLDAGVATVGADGMVRTVAEGTTAVVATVDGVTDTAEVSVLPPVVRTVTLHPALVDLLLADSTQLTVELRDVRGQQLSDRVVTWSSTNPSIAAVSGTGMVTGNAPGAATVIATGEGVADSTTVRVVTVPVASVTLSVDSTDLERGDTLRLTATSRDSDGNVLLNRAVTWTALDAAVATVDDRGLVTGVSVGTARVIARSGSAVDTAVIRVVRPPVVSVVVSSDTLRLASDAPVTVTATGYDGRGHEVEGVVVTWTSADTTVATVNPDGEVRARANGAATVTADIEGVTATVVVLVEVGVRSVEVSPGDAFEGIGRTLQVGFVARNAWGDAMAATPQWRSADTTVATVDVAGKVTIVRAGTTTVTATVTNGDGSEISGTVAVTGAPLLADGVPRSRIGVAAGERAMFAVVVPAGTTAIEVWSSGGTPDAALALFAPGVVPAGVANAACASATAGNREWCRVPEPATGTWRVVIDAAESAAVADLSLSAGLTSAGDTASLPAPPTDLTATAVSASRIDLAWTDAASNETGYRVERCSGAACTNFSVLFTQVANTTRFEDHGLAASATYRYRVVTVGTGGATVAGPVVATTHAP